LLPRGIAVNALFLDNLVRARDSGGGEFPMNEEALNLSIRKFLKTVGVNSQREIEHAVAKAAAAGAIAGTESFPAKMTLEIAGLEVKVEFSGDITLQ
jgi:hypothetical protein